MDPYFIDRHNYVKTFFHLLEQRNIIQFVADTCSEYGTGKTTVLSTLFYEIEARYPNFKPLWLSLDQFSAHYQNPKLVELSVVRQDERSALIEVQNLIDYHDLLVELSKESLNNTIPFASMLETSSLDALRQTLGEQYIVTASAKDA
jgi:hypothetical protein